MYKMRDDLKKTAGGLVGGDGFSCCRHRRTNGTAVSTLLKSDTLILITVKPTTFPGLQRLWGGLPVEEGCVSSEGWESWRAEARWPSSTPSEFKWVLTKPGMMLGSTGCRTCWMCRFLAKYMLQCFWDEVRLSEIKKGKRDKLVRKGRKRGGKKGGKNERKKAELHSCIGFFLTIRFVR